VIGYEFISKGFSRRNIDTNESDPRDSLVGMRSACRPAERRFGVPAETYGFENKLLAWETFPAARILLALRSSHLRDPSDRRSTSGSEQFHRRDRRCNKRGSGPRSG